MLRFGLILGILLVATTASAAGLVPCGDSAADECTLSDLIGLGQNIINFLIYIGVFIGVLMIAWAGATLLLSQGNESAMEKAKSRIWNVVIGFVIILLAYLIINTILFVLTGGGFEKWKIGRNAPVQTNAATTQTSANAAGAASSQRCVNCTAVSNLPIKNGACSGQSSTQGCQVNGQLATRLGALNSSLESSQIDWQITEAYPPTVVHQNACHSAGTCVDANCIGSCSGTQIKTFIAASESANLKPVYEVRSQGEYETLARMGIDEKNLAVVPHITAAHFSVYTQ